MCRKHYQQAWKAGELDAHEKLPPRVKDRKICPTGHRHGEVGTCYVHHQCRCADCVSSQTKRNYRRLQLKAYGRYDTGLVDAGPVREHMMALAEFGLGYKRVAQLAGVGVTAVRSILWGRQEPGPRYGELPKRVKRETAEAVLAVQPVVENLAGGALVPALGVQRRLQALVARGWSQSKLSVRLGLNLSNLNQMFDRDLVMAATHRAVSALFDEIWDVAPPLESKGDKIAYSRAMRYAKERRWLPPLAWDDIDTDVEPPVPDEEVGVDEVRVELAAAGELVRLSSAELRAAVRLLHGMRFSDRAIAERLRVADRTVLRIRQELGLTAAVGADRRPNVA